MHIFFCQKSHYCVFHLLFYKLKLWGFLLLYLKMVKSNGMYAFYSLTSGVCGPVVVGIMSGGYK